MNGGYIMIDGTGIELTSQSTTTVTGIFDKVNEAYEKKKPVYVVNITFEQDVMSPVAVMINPRPSGNYICTASTLQIEVDPDDGVTIHNMVQ